MSCESCGKPTDALGVCTGVCDDPADYRRDDYDDRYGDDVKKYQRRRLAVLLILCTFAVALAVSLIAAEHANAESFDEWYAQPENRDWYHFQQWYGASPRNASYYHLREHFGTGRLGDRAIQIAQCESGLNPRAVSPTNDHGVMQLNAPSWRYRFEQVTGMAWNPNVYHASYNVAFARWLHDETGGFSHWACAR